MRFFSGSICSLVFWALFAPVADAASEFTEEVERVIPLRSSGALHVINNRGDVIIEGWAQDKIRVRGKKHANAESAEEAKRLFAAIDFRHHAIEDGIELSAEYGRGLTIEERLKERSNPRTGMAIHVLAPPGVPLKVWAVNGKISLKSWKGSVEIRSASGEVRVESVRGGNSVSILCPACAIEVSGVKGTVRCMGGSGGISLTEVDGQSIYIESDEGPVTVKRVRGEQLYVLRGAPLSVSDSNGHIEFHAQQGSIRIENGSGFVSGRTTSGNIFAGMDRWSFQDKALIESVSGNISLQLPSAFSAELDIRSVRGKVAVGIPVHANASRATPATLPGAQHIVGTAGDGGELLRIFSESGDIKVTDRKN